MVKNMDKRVSTAVKSGFTRIVAPVGTKKVVAKGLQNHIVTCKNVQALQEHLGVKRRPRKAHGRDKVDTEE
jgi:predicted ATP-dependent serine protease